jgi:hypothetical protein
MFLGDISRANASEVMEAGADEVVFITSIFSIN